VLYPALEERLVVGDFFDPPDEVRGSFDMVIEHTCMSGLHPTLRTDYRRGIDLTLKRGGLVINVWFINPDLDPGDDGRPILSRCLNWTHSSPTVTRSWMTTCRTCPSKRD
jgi:hypothetical protein